MGPSVPNIEEVGQLVPEPFLGGLRRDVQRLLNVKNDRFPGAQPVSFSREHLRELQAKDYYVCEKSDGIRCLLYFTKRESEPNVFDEAHYLIDRKNNYYWVPKLHFPRPADKDGVDPDWQSYHVDTVVDGELLWDTYPDGQRHLKYLVFDCLVVDGQSLMQRTLDSRLAYFFKFILQPYHGLWSRFRDDCEENFAFRVEKKSTQRAYGITMMFQDVIPRLKHTSDGLIFTCRETPYRFGTDDNILKWKPAEENTIDFKMDLRFAVIGQDADAEMTNGHDEGWAGAEDHDYTRLPTIKLHLFGGERAPDQEFGILHLTPAEWDKMKLWAMSREDGLDGQIIECHQDKEKRWCFNRFRDDKAEANHISVAERVMDSINDGVSKQDLEDAARAIRLAWKAREERTAGEMKDKEERDARAAKEAREAQKEAAEARAAREAAAAVAINKQKERPGSAVE